MKWTDKTVNIGLYDGLNYLKLQLVYLFKVMIDSMEDKMDRIHERLVKETKNIRLIDRASGTCGLWMLIVLLLIAIIVIVAIPKK